MLGRAAIAMWWEIPPAQQAEFEDWHSHEHMPERLAIPGFLRGSRWLAASGEPSYFVLYEAARLATIRTGPYLQHLNNPTPWSRKMMPHHRNMVRSLCRVRASSGGGLGQFMMTIRFSPGKRRALPDLQRRRGVTGMQLLESQPMAGSPTTEQKIRGGDAQADWVLLVCGYDVDALKPVAAELALPGGAAGLYRLAFSMTSRDLPR